jgi:hypothetical protein
MANNKRAAFQPPFLLVCPGLFVSKDRMHLRSLPSSPAKAGDPVFQDVSDRAEKTQYTGYSAFAEYDARDCIKRACCLPSGTRPSWLRSQRDRAEAIALTV